jgi:sorting nexin-8
MFNAPRPTQAYGISSSFGGSYVDENPLAASTYDGLDPWSAAPSPSPPPGQVPSIFTNAIAEATVPAIYQQSFGAVDPTNSGETSVNSLSRVLSTSSLPAAKVDKIVNLVSTRPRVSKLEFFVALALVALAQTGKDVSVEQVALLAQQNTLPEPTLDLSLLSYSPPPPPSLSAAYTNNQQPSTAHNSSSGSAAAAATATAAVMQRSASISTSATVVAPPPDDPWMTGPRYAGAGVGATPFGVGGINGGGGGVAPPSSVSGTGLPSGWWKRQEKVTVQFSGQQGFVLNRYMVYGISTERGSTVHRRYSEFAFLWDCLVRRYPFRLLPQLPPKRIGRT